MKGLHRYFLLVVVTSLEFRVVDRDVLLDVFARKRDLFIFAGSKHTHKSPVGNGDGHAEDSNEEEIRFEPALANEREQAFE